MGDCMADGATGKGWYAYLGRTGKRKGGIQSDPLENWNHLVLEPRMDSQNSHLPARVQNLHANFAVVAVNSVRYNAVAHGLPFVRELGGERRDAAFAVGRNAAWGTHGREMCV